MNPKYWRVEMKDGKSTCPWCEAVNNHRTGHSQTCEHVAKVTASGAVFYYWGFRPIKEAA
jgi:hypothetical protein